MHPLLEFIWRFDMRASSSDSRSASMEVVRGDVRGDVFVHVGKRAVSPRESFSRSGKRTKARRRGSLGILPFSRACRGFTTASEARRRGRKRASTRPSRRGRTSFVEGDDERELMVAIVAFTTASEARRAHCVSGLGFRVYGVANLSRQIT